MQKAKDYRQKAKDYRQKAGFFIKKNQNRPYWLLDMGRRSAYWTPCGLLDIGGTPSHRLIAFSTYRLLPIAHRQ